MLLMFRLDPCFFRAGGPTLGITPPWIKGEILSSNILKWKWKQKTSATQQIIFHDISTLICANSTTSLISIYIYILYLQALAVHASHPIARRISTPKCTWSGSMSQTGSKNSPCCRLWAVRWWAWMGESVCYSCIGQLDSWRLDTTFIKR